MRKIRIIISALLIALFALGCAVALGAAYNALSLRHYRAIAGIPGKIYDVDGYPMHLYCTGRGSPAVVLEAGLGDDFLTWAKVQPQLSHVTTVCSYDRAGFGWSALRPGRQDAVAISGELHQLLTEAGITQPIILMGHSIGGLYLRAYAAHYPKDLAGLVFVDGATPLQDDRVPRALIKIQDQQRRDMPWERFWMEVGWYRIQGQCARVRRSSERYAAWIRADECVPSQITAIEGELDAERMSGEETLHAGPFASLPILVLSRDPSSRPSNWPPDVAKANAITWNIMQEEAKSLSPHSRRIIARRSDHNIQADRPDLVNNAVTSFITDIRNHDLSHLDGTTIYE
jgi:pimeloyl-ACP methyl ester carboxylesterase